MTAIPDPKITMTPEGQERLLNAVMWPERMLRAMEKEAVRCGMVEQWFESHSSGPGDLLLIFHRSHISFEHQPAECITGDFAYRIWFRELLVSEPLPGGREGALRMLEMQS